MGTVGALAQTSVNVSTPGPEETARSVSAPLPLFPFFHVSISMLLLLQVGVPLVMHGLMLHQETMLRMYLPSARIAEFVIMSPARAIACQATRE